MILTNENEPLRMFNDRVLKLSEKLNGLGIKWCFMREADVIMHDANSGGDIDIWVDKNFVTIAAENLVKDGWRVLRGTCIPGRRFSIDAAFLRFQKTDKNGREIFLDLSFGEVKWRSFVYLSSSLVDRCICYCKGLPFIQGAALQAVLSDRMILRLSFSGNRLERSRKAYKELNEKDRLLWHHQATNNFGEKNTERIRRWMEGTSEPCLIIQLYMILIYISKHLRYIKAAIGKIKILLKRMFILKKMLMVGFVGTDGSGKSTTLMNFANYLGCHDKKNKIGSIYWGRARGNTFLLSMARNFINNKITSAKKREQPQQKQKRRDTNFLTLLAACAYIADYWIRYCKGILPNLFSRRLLLFDRGPSDIAAMPGNSRLLRKISLLGPKMDLLIFCNARPKIIYQRKQEREIREIKHQQEIFKKMIFSARNGVMICTEQAEKEVVNWMDLAIQLCVIHRKGFLENELYLFLLRQISSFQDSAFINTSRESARLILKEKLYGMALRN